MRAFLHCLASFDHCFACTAYFMVYLTVSFCCFCTIFSFAFFDNLACSTSNGTAKLFCFAKLDFYTCKRGFFSHPSVSLSEILLSYLACRSLCTAKCLIFFLCLALLSVHFCIFSCTSLSVSYFCLHFLVCFIFGLYAFFIGVFYIRPSLSCACPRTTLRQPVAGCQLNRTQFTQRC